MEGILLTTLVLYIVFIISAITSISIDHEKDVFVNIVIISGIGTIISLVVLIYKLWRIT